MRESECIIIRGSDWRKTPNAMHILRPSRTTSPRQPRVKKLGSEIWAESTKLERAQTDFSRTKGDRRLKKIEDISTEWWPLSESSIPTGYFHAYTLFMSREGLFWKYNQGEPVRYKGGIFTSGMRVGLGAPLSLWVSWMSRDGEKR